MKPARAREKKGETEKERDDEREDKDNMHMTHIPQIKPLSHPHRDRRPQ